MSDRPAHQQDKRPNLLVNLGSGAKGSARLPAMFADWRELRGDIDAKVAPDILADDGFLCVIVPDLQTIAEYIASDRLHEVVYESPAGPVIAHDIVFGFGPHLAQGRIKMAHNCGFTPTLLLQKLREAPFAQIVLRRRTGHEL